MLSVISSRLEKTSDLLEVFFKNNWAVIGLIFLAGIYAFGFELANFGMSVDEEFFWGVENRSYWAHIRNQRPSAYLYYLLMPGQQYPFISIFTGLLVLSLAVAVWRGKTHSMAATFIAGSLIVSSPVWAHQHLFLFQSAYVCCSVAIAVFAYVICVAASKYYVKLFAPALLAAFAICTYQTIIFIPCALLFIDALARGEFAKNDFINLLYIMAFSFLAFLLYKLQAQIFSLYSPYPMYDRIDEMITWGKKPISDILQDIFSYLYHFMKGEVITYQNIPFLLVPAFLYLMADKPAQLLQRGVCLALLALYFLFCYGIFGDNKPSRTLLFIPFLYGGLFLGAFCHAKIWGKYILFALGIYVLLLNASINTKLFMHDAFSFERDKAITFNIANSLYAYEQNHAGDFKYVCIIGKLILPAAGPRIVGFNRESFGKSFYNWDNGNPDRMKSLLGHFGMLLPKNLPPEMFQENGELISLARSMPSYPQRGYIGEYNDILIIKLSGLANAFYKI